MKYNTTCYPVDRYMVESSKGIEMVNIIDDEIWNSEPGFRPEDDKTLRKLHEMLQSTADDLKLLSGELTKSREPGVQVITLPMPLDEDFNEKIHIEEVVNAKFHGYKIIDKPSAISKQQNNTEGKIKSVAKLVNTGVQVKDLPVLKKANKPKSLGFSRTRVVQLNGSELTKPVIEKSMTKVKNVNKSPAVTYNEFYYNYEKPVTKTRINKNLQIQEMPSINIRRELKEQKVLNLDILPDNQDVQKSTDNQDNVAVISIKHETNNTISKKKNDFSNAEQHSHAHKFKQPLRKVLKMSTYESSDSANNMSSDNQYRLKKQDHIRKIVKTSPKNIKLVNCKKKKGTFTKGFNRSHVNLEDWKRKISIVYGQGSGLQKDRNKHKGNTNTTSKKSSFSSFLPNKSTRVFNNTEYIPYSQLTLGGVRVSDIEKEISNIPNKSDVPLSPILDKILSSCENSFQNESPRKYKTKSSSKVFTTSDENLLQEVIHIEKTVSQTLSKNLSKNSNETLPKTQDVTSDDNTDNHSYADDFEEENSNDGVNSKRSLTPTDEREDTKPTQTNLYKDKEFVAGQINDNEHESITNKSNTNVLNVTYTKSSNLSFKSTVDVFEYIHSVNTQDTATQSNSLNKITPKETQTSPQNESANIHPIHNNLWQSSDPVNDIDKMFKLEKELIKKLIIEEYADLLEKNVINKPSTSNVKPLQNDSTKNVAASQKNTQTSPAHVKSVMTSPTQVKTRTTSPFAVSFKVDHQTSPLIFVTNEEAKVISENEADDLRISINLSSPRFNLRLPQTSHEVLSNLEFNLCSPVQENESLSDKITKNKSYQLKRYKQTYIKDSVSSSSSVDGDVSSSDLSSLGELKLIRKLSKRKTFTVSDSSSTSSFSKISLDEQSSKSDILPLKSEGEVSSLKYNIRKYTKHNNSEGELNFEP